MMPTVTLFFAAACALINIWLGVRCGQVRASAKISHGDGGNLLLQRRMRAQLNYAENTPLIVILVLALELAGGSATVLAVIAAAYAIARICHALGMDADASPLRNVGILVTMLSAAGLAGWAIYTGYTLATPHTLPAEIGTRA